MKTIFCAVYGFFFLVAVANAVEVKSSAPLQYEVKKGDTLWQVAGMYLDKPWNWPLLWQKNEQINNPHLIYPGDIIYLTRTAEGAVSLSMQRTKKRFITLSPTSKKQSKSTNPVPAISWSEIQHHIDNDLVMDESTYHAHPYLLGDMEGAVRFAHTDVVLGKKAELSRGEFQIVRRHKEILSAKGEGLGYLVKNVADAKLIDSDIENEILVKIVTADMEVKPGDRLLPKKAVKQTSNVVLAAATSQKGTILTTLQDRALMGKYDAVVVDLSHAEVHPGTVLGIYQQGPNIVDGDPVRYDENKSRAVGEDVIAQPAIKVGELVIFKTFDKVSYGLITRSTKVIKKGAIVAKP